MTYCHSQHRQITSLRRLLPEPLVEISAQAALERNIAARDWVRVSTTRGAFIARAKVLEDIEPGSVFAQHGWWLGAADNSTPADSAARDIPALIDSELPNNLNGAIDTTLEDPISGSIALRCSWCEVVTLAPKELAALRLQSH